MAILTGALMYRGSFKSIRNYRNLYDSNTYAGEKGGANRDLILHNPAFARTRENMSEFGGCGAAVKAIRRGFQNLLPEQADAHFTGRLMRLTKEINLRDTEGVRGRRSIFFSANRSILRNIVFNSRVNLSEMMQCCFSYSHSLSRDFANLSVMDLTINQAYVPEGATHFRIQHHLSIISDYVFSEGNGGYEASCLINGLSAFGYSGFTPVLSALTSDISVSFPAGISLTDDCTVMQCIGVEFFIRSFGNVYLPLKGGCVKLTDVF